MSLLYSDEGKMFEDGRFSMWMVEWMRLRVDSTSHSFRDHDEDIQLQHESN